MTDASHVETVVEKPLSWLRPFEGNPRTLSEDAFERLKHSLADDATFLWARPVVARPDGTIIAGHMRWRAAEALGWTEIPTVVADVDDDTAAVWNLLDNNVAGEWDDQALAEMLFRLGESGVDLSLTGFAEDELKRRLEAVAGDMRVFETDPDDVPPLPVEPKSRLGEVYELGDHRLLCGDATDPVLVAKLMGGERAGLLFTSPPYFDLRTYGGDVDLDPGKLAAFVPVWAEHTDLLAVNLGLVVRGHAVVPWWQAYLDTAAAAGLKLLAWNVWNREDATNPASQQMMFPVWHEWVFVFGDGPKTPNKTVPTKHPGSSNASRSQRNVDGSITRRPGPATGSLKALGSVLTLPSSKGPSPGDHPAVFPVALPHSYIEAVTDPGEVVADPFVGSGTTVVAAEMTGRVAYVAEVDPGYCDVVRRRYADFVGDDSFAP